MTSVMVLMLLASFNHLSGQAPVKPGDHVRVRFEVTSPVVDPDTGEQVDELTLREQVEGSVEGSSETMLTLRMDDRIVDLAWEDIRRISVRVGRRTDPLGGLWKGAVAGFLVGGGVFAAAYPAEQEVSFLDEFIFGGVLGVPLGGLVGLVVGAKRETDQWEKVPIPPVQPTIQHSPDGRFELRFSIPLGR